MEPLIREAMERGEFDNLKGKGEPLDLDAYFSTAEHIRMGFSILKSNEFVPEEVEMLKDVARSRSNSPRRQTKTPGPDSRNCCRKNNWHLP